MDIFKTSGSQTSRLMGIKGLGDAGVSYLKEWLTQQWVGYRKEFSNKYTSKGLRQEKAGIELVSEINDLGYLIKNVVRLSNDWAEGECDLLMGKSIRDIKCSWDAFTFPQWDKEPKNNNYFWQAQTYMWLWDRETYFLDYCLVDAPEDQITKEYWRKHNELCVEGDEIDDTLYEEVSQKMIFSYLPPEQRVKTYIFQRDDKKIDLIKERVELGREEIKILIKR